MATSTSSIGGLISGLDSKTLVANLMAVAAQPQNKLKTQLTSTNGQVTAAQSINSKAASMTSLAQELSDTKTYTTATASSSNASVTASAGPTAAAASISFVVTDLARAYSFMTGKLAAPSDPPAATSFQLVRPGDDPADAVTITAASGSAEDIAKAINDFAGPDGEGSGVKAVVVNDGTGQRLQLTSTTTGADTALSISGLSDDGSSAVLETGADAKIRISGPSGLTSSPVEITSPSNTFTGLLPGVDVTVSKVLTDTDPARNVVTVSTAVSSSSITGKVTGLVASMNAVLSDVAFHTKSLTGGAKASATNGGLLAGQATFRDLAGSLLDAISASTGTDAAVKAGLSVTREGTITFDASKLEALLKSEPATAQAVLTAFGAAVQSVGKGASDAVTGSVTGFVTGSRSTVTSLTDRIADWDVRLDAKQTRLTAQYAALETALQKLKSQGDALTSALESLNNNN